MTTHTPGPLTVSRYGRIGFEIQGHGRSIAVVNRVQDKRLEHVLSVRKAGAKRGTVEHQADLEAAQLALSKDQAFADATLYAAAPEMLAALKLIREHGYQPGHGRLLAVVDAAIAKAEGRA